MILTKSTSSPNQSRKQTNNSKQHKIKKEERSLKCKSNTDSYIYTKNAAVGANTSSNTVTNAVASRLIKNKSTKILTTINKIKSSSSSNSNGTTANSKFAKLNTKTATALSGHLFDDVYSNKKNSSSTSHQLSVSFKELEKAASTCSSTSFNTSSQEGSSGVGGGDHGHGGKNLNLSPSISLTSSSASSYPSNDVCHMMLSRSPKNRHAADRVTQDPNVTNTTSSDLLNVAAEIECDDSSSSQKLFLLNSLSTPVMIMSQSLTESTSNTEHHSSNLNKSMCHQNPNDNNSSTIDESLSGEYLKSQQSPPPSGVKQSLSVSMNMSQASTSSGTIKSRSSRLINSIIRMSTIGSPFSSSTHSPQINRSSTIDSTMSSPKQPLNAVSSRAAHHASSYFPSSTTNENTTNRQQISTSSSNVNVPKTQTLTTKSNSSDMPCTSGCIDSKKAAVNLVLNTTVIREEESSGGSSNSESSRFVPVEKWDATRITQWLENLGMLSSQIKNAQKTVQNGKVCAPVFFLIDAQEFFISFIFHFSA
jgi:hypothetical protein